VTDPQPAQGWSSVGFKIDGVIAGDGFSLFWLPGIAESRMNTTFACAEKARL
jgi:hypothetical protein